MNNKIVKATKWSFITEILAKAISPITNVILAHILAPEAFGILATVLMVISFAEMIADAGFQKYLVQYEFKDEEDKKLTVNMAFTANFIFAIFLWGIIIIFRNYLAELVGNPGLGFAMAIMGMYLPLSAFSSIQMSIYRREFDYKFLFNMRLIIILSPILVSIPLALLGFDYWALIIGVLSGQFLSSIMLLFYSKIPVKIYFNYKVLKRMLGFSFWSMGESCTIWLSSWVDLFLISHYLSAYYLGIYRMPIAMVNAAMAIVTNAILPIVFAALSRVQNDNKQFEKIFFDFQRYIALLMFPLGVLIFVFRDLSVKIMLGNQWHDAAIVLGCWALSNTIMVSISYLISEVFRAKGLPRLSVVTQILHLLVLVPVIMYFIRGEFSNFVYARSLIRLQLVLTAILFLHYFIKFPVLKIFSNIAKYIFLSTILLVVAEGLASVSRDFYWQVGAFVFSVASYVLMLVFFKEDRLLLGRLYNKIKF